jgi:hypothetical protein
MNYKWLAAAVLMVGGMGVANARTDVSIGIGLPLPGVVYGGGYYAPPPPPPVYYGPVYRERVYYPEPVYYAPRPVYYGPRYYGPRGRDVHYERDVQYRGGYDRHVEYDRYDRRH